MNDSNQHREPRRDPGYTPGGIQLVFFRTAAGPSPTTYPTRASNPTVYYGEKLANVTFDETVGAQTLSYDATGQFGHFFNLAASDYIEEGSVVLCFRKNARYFTIDKVKAAMRIVVVHDDFETGAATGGVTMVASDSGDAIWTYRMPIDSGTGRRKRATSVKIGPTGYIYVAWDTTENGWGMQGDREADGPAGGLIKLTSSGALVWDIAFPEKSASYDRGGFGARIFGAQVALDPTDDSRVWVGASCDENDQWLHLVNASNGSILASYGNAEFDDQIASSTYDWTQFAGSVTLARCDDDGRLWLAADCTTPQVKTKLTAIDADGNILWSDLDDFSGPFVLDTLDVTFTINGKPIIVGESSSSIEHVAFRIDVFDGDDEDWQVKVSEFTPAGGGVGWFTPYDHDMAAVESAGANFVAAAFSGPSWEDDEGDFLIYNLFGFNLTSGAEWVTRAEVGGWKRLAHNADTESFTVLLGSNHYIAVPFLHRLNPVDGSVLWSSSFGTADLPNPGLQAHDVDVRFV